MRILITGSKGLVGSALKKALQLLHVTVIGIDKNEDLKHADYGNILHKETLFPKVEQVEGIVHLAAVSRVIDGEKDPSLCWETNVEGTKNIVQAALASEKKPWILYASSREVYGQQSDFPVKESTPLYPVNIYGESKQEGEQVVNRAKKKGLLTSIVRFSNIYGSVHDHHDRVVPAFCRAAVKGDQMRVDGSEHLFDFTYLEDVIQGILSIIRLLAYKKESLLPIHLVSGIPISLGQIAKIAQKVSDYEISIVEGISRSFDVSKFWGDTSRAKKILNWKACVPVEEGMRRLIAQYRIFFEMQKNMTSPIEDKIEMLS